MHEEGNKDVRIAMSAKDMGKNITVQTATVTLPLELAPSKNTHKLKSDALVTVRVEGKEMYHVKS